MLRIRRENFSPIAFVRSTGRNNLRYSHAMAGENLSETMSFRQTLTGELVGALERLAEAGSIEEVVETIRRTARRLVGSDGITIVVREGDLCHYVEEDAVGPLWKGGRFAMTDCISGWSMMNRKQAIVPDIYKDDRVPHDLYRATFVRSLVMTPIRDHEPLGAIGAYWAQPYDPSMDEIETLKSLARASAGARQCTLPLMPEFLML